MHTDAASGEPSEKRSENRRPRPFAGLRGFRRGDLLRQISAGITLAALIIPLNIGYAQVAGARNVYGLFDKQDWRSV